MEVKKLFTKKRVLIALSLLILFGLVSITTSNSSTASEIKSRFNAYANEAHFSYKIDNIEIKEAAVENSFDIHLSKLLVFGGALNKDNSMKLVYAICSGDGTPTSGENTINLMTAVIAVADPSLKPAERIDVLNKLGALNSDVSHLDNRYSNKGVSYEIHSTPEWVKLSASL